MSRARDYRRRSALSGWLLAGICFCAVVLSGRLHWRLDLTAAGSNSLDDATRDLLGQLQDRLQIKLYFNRDIEGAEHLLPDRLRIQDLLAEIEGAGRGRVSVETVDPTTDLVAARDAEHLGIQPITVQDQRIAGVSIEKLYQGLELRYQDRSELIPFVVPARFEFAFATRLQSLLRGGERPLLAFFSREPMLPPPVPGMDQEAPPGRVFERLREILGARYAIRDYRGLGPGEAVPEEALALVVLRPERVTAAEVEAIDAYLRGGGRVVVLYDHEEVLPQRGFEKRTLESGVDAWLAGYGVEVRREFVYDEGGKAMPVDVQLVTLPDGRTARNPIFDAYGLYPVIGTDGLNQEHVVTASLEEAEFVWAHPVVYQPRAGLDLQAEVLVRSSSRSWRLGAATKVGITLSNVKLMRTLIAQAGAPQPSDLVLALRGNFGEESAEGVLVVVGDSDLFHNLNFDTGPANVPFALNLIDWLAADEALIELRSRGDETRRLRSFYADSLERQGGRGATPAANRAIDRQAREDQLSMERRIAWVNLLLPGLLLLLAGVGHFGYHRLQDKRWQEAD